MEENKYTLLVVEDDLELLQVYKAIFESNGYSLFEAENGKKAIDIYKKHADEIALIILDMILPDITGDEVLKEIHKIDPDQTVIICTGYPEKTLSNISENIQFLQKPFLVPAVLEMVENGCKNSKT